MTSNNSDSNNGSTNGTAKADASMLDDSAAAASSNSSVKEFNGSTNVHISVHPIIAHKITILRSSTTHCGTFRAVLKELTYHLGYEATTTLTTHPVDISVPWFGGGHRDHKGHKLAERIALIPILRSGLGMVDSMLELLPNAQVHHIGMYKAHRQDRPVQYYNRLPRRCNSDVAYVLDTVIATSSTVMSVVQILKKWGVPQIHIIAAIASKGGIQQLIDQHPDVHITVGVVDDVGDDGRLVPGLGDSGDRLFGTAPADEDDESLLHPSRRKRSASQS